MQSKFRFGRDVRVFMTPKHVNKFHATKAKDLVGSYQTLLLGGRSKAKIMWVNCIELTIFVLT